MTARSSIGGERTLEELQQVIEEQAALQRIATLVARVDRGRAHGCGHVRDRTAVPGAPGEHHALEGDTIRVIGAWSVDRDQSQAAGLIFPFGGDTTTARIVDTNAPARVDSASDLRSELARKLWAERGLHASIGAPIVVGGTIWGVVDSVSHAAGRSVSVRRRTAAGRLRSARRSGVVNAEARRETAGLVAEQTALRRVATLVAGGRPETEVLDAVIAEVGAAVRGNHASPSSAGKACRTRSSSSPPGASREPSRSASARSTIRPRKRHARGARDRVREPVRGDVARARDVLRDRRPGDHRRLAARGSHRVPRRAARCSRPAPRSGCAASPTSRRQSIANERAQAELRASRARIVRAADEARRRLERNLHDGAQQRLVSLSLELRLALAKLPDAPDDAREILVEASAELKGRSRSCETLPAGCIPWC